MSADRHHPDRRRSKRCCRAKPPRMVQGRQPSCSGLFWYVDDVEEASGDATAPATGLRRWRPGRVADIGQRLVGLRHDAGIVEFMAAQHAPCGVTWNGLKQRRGPVAEMQA